MDNLIQAICIASNEGCDFQGSSQVRDGVSVDQVTESDDVEPSANDEHCG